MIILNPGHITHPGVSGFMTTDGHMWYGVGYDEEGNKHVLVSDTSEFAKGNIQWYTWDNFPYEHANIIISLILLLRRSQYYTQAKGL